MSLFSSIVEFVFPRECHICGSSLPAGTEYVCPSCVVRLPRTLYHRITDNPMERRFMGQFPFRAATGHFFYSRGSDLAVLMHDLKYRKFAGLARMIGRLVGTELLPTGFLSDIDFILPIPMHFLKKARRGYNQTEIIASGLSEVSGIPVLNNLYACRGHRTQTSLTLEQRLKNIENVFALRNPGSLTDKKLLLLDDVCTTGTTLASAATLITGSVQGTEVSLLTIGVTF